MNAVTRTLCALFLFCMTLWQTVQAQLHADFMAKPAGGCTPVFVQFTDMSTGNPASWKWDLGNGTISYLQHPSAIYFNPGKYTIKLVIRNGMLSDSVVKQNEIVITALPQPRFKASDTIGCYPLKVLFTDQSIAREGNIIKWEWDLGDGTLSSEQNPTHIYTQPGNYNVILRVTNAAGCVSTVSRARYIKIKDGVKADFAYTGSSQCTPPSLVSFTNKSTGTGILSYQWSFGDGNSSRLQSPSHIYTTAGLYTPQLIVKNSTGCIDTLIKKDSIAVGAAKAAFSAPDSVCQGMVFQLFNASQPATGNLHWSFGNDSVSAATNPFTFYKNAGTYAIKLVADFGSCKDAATKTIKVLPRPKAAFTANNTASCKAPLTVSFSSLTPNAIAYKWFFGDSSTSTLANPQHTYLQNGLYTVKLVVTNANGCTDTLTQPDYISAQPAVIKINAIPVNGCAPLLFNPGITVHSVIPIVSYTWNFGDGTVYTGNKPYHIYSHAGVYSIQLTYTTSDGCTGTISYPNAVQAGQKPGASFSADPTNTCASTPINFTDQSTGKITDWLWNFGDGITDTSRNPMHRYNDTGYFHVQLIASNNGCADTLLQRRYIYIKPPVAKFAASALCDDPYHFTFSNYSVGAGSWTWDFGDGITSSDQNPVHVYAEKGSYPVRLTVSNGTCTHVAGYQARIIIEKADFTASGTSVCKGDSVLLQPAGLNASNIIAYNWTLDYRNDTARTIKTAYSKSGKYTVSLAITNINGCTDIVTKKDFITVNGPVADFSNNNAACLKSGGDIVFNDASGTDGTHAIKTWQWNYGDGAPLQTYSSGPFHHTYTAEGMYAVSLKVTDTNGCSDSIVRAGQVYIANPRAAFGSNDTMSCRNKLVSFSSKSAGQGLTYAWNFGDGTGAAGTDPVHAFAAVGTYNAWLKITDRYGCTDSLFKPAYIHIDDPKAAFLMSDSVSSCPPLVVNFTNQSVYYQQLSWDFGDGTGSVTNNPVHYYNYPGTYYPRLTIISPGGCIDAFSRKIEIKGPTGSFTYNKTASCNPGTIDFTAQTQNAQFFIWDYNDGGTLNTRDSLTSHKYTAAGIYLPRLILQDDKGCKVPIQGKDTLHIYGVTALFGNNTSIICDKGLVNFTDSSVSNDLITAYQWQTGDGGQETDKNPAHYYAASGVYPVRLIVTTLNGCTDTSAQQRSIKVINSPRISISGDTAACPASLHFYGNLDMADTSALGWKWDFGNNSGQSSLQNPQPVTYTNAGNYAVTLLATNSSGCTATSTRQVVIHPIPLVSAGKSRAVCENKAATLEATGADRYTWTPGTTLSCTQCASPVASPATTTAYQVKGETVFGCTASDAVIISVKHPFKMQAGAGDTLCKGASFHLQAANAELYEWTPSAGLDNRHSRNPVARPDQTTTYRVIGYDDIGCFYDTAFVKLVVYPFPTVDAGPDKTIAVSASVELHAKVSADASIIQWQPSTGLSCSNCADPVANPRQTTTYRVMAMNKGGCMNKDEITVFVICNNGNIFLPNTFSPDGNGTNDVFYPRGTGLYNIRSMRIFNRWGEPVFEASNFKANDASKGWNGTFRNKPAPNDVYVYFVEVICENNAVLTYSGNITLIR